MERHLLTIHITAKTLLSIAHVLCMVNIWDVWEKTLRSVRQPPLWSFDEVIS